MNQSKTKVLIFDFDGVILDSMKVRERGFREIFKKYDKDKTEELIKFHHFNGGLSRFIKIRYFYENILKKELSQEKLEQYVKLYSIIMRNELHKKKYLISDTLTFIQEQYRNFDMHIVSGSEHEELNYLCKALEIDKFFLSISGSPLMKYEIISSLIKKNSYSKDEIIMIGDSINDYDSSVLNGIKFYGFNNKHIKSVSDVYITSFKVLKIT